MNRQIVNQTCYQKNQQNLQEQRRQTYLKNKQQPKTNTKSNLANYYHANNIKVLITLKDYIESSPEKMKFWYRFSSVLSQIKEGVSDIIEIMRLKEVMEDLISDYWTSAKKQLKITKRWNKLTPAQQQAKRKQWAKQLEQEEKELLANLAKQEQAESKKQATFNYANETEKPTPKSKIECPECKKWVKELDEENDMCWKCVKSYEE